MDSRYEMGRQAGMAIHTMIANKRAPTVDHRHVFLTADTLARTIRHFAPVGQPAPYHGDKAVNRDPMHHRLLFRHSIAYDRSLGMGRARVRATKASSRPAPFGH